MIDRRNACFVLLALSLSPVPAWGGTEGIDSTFYGLSTGSPADQDGNTFIGASAGHSTTTGTANAFLGLGAGQNNVTGASNLFAGAFAGANSNASDNTFLGFSAGESNSSGLSNTFVGSATGITNSTGVRNTFLGYGAGTNINGSYNTYVGFYAGYGFGGLPTGSGNTALGDYAGYSNQGGGNVFLGNEAGYYETGSNRLYIDNCVNSGACTPPFIYGEFDNHLLRINGMTEIHANGIAKSQMNFSQSSTDTGGYLTSVLDNNFFMSSGARYNAAAGGWVQRSSDQQAVIQGSGSLGYRVFTSSGHAVGSTFTPTVRLHLDYNGNLGLNTPAVAGVPIQHVSGAHLTSGGVWTDASSREYKENVRPLSAEQAMKTVGQLVPVTYNYKVDSDEKHVGFIAEDVPELVATKDRKSLSPMDIVAVLTRVVRDKTEVIERQQAELASIEAQLAEETALIGQQQADLHRLEARFAAFEARLPAARP